MSIAQSFASYSFCVLTCLELKPVTVEKLCAYLLSLPSFTCGQDSANQSLMLLSTKKAKLEEARSIAQIFKILNSECCSFLNYGILERLILKFELELDEENSNYPEKLRKYINEHKISEFIEIKPILNKLNSDSKELVLLLDLESTRTLSNLIDVKKMVAIIMGLKQSALLIYDIKEHCVVLTLLLPTPVADFIFNSATMFDEKQEKEFQSLSVRSLKCNGFTFNFNKERSGSSTGEVDCFVCNT